MRKVLVAVSAALLLAAAGASGALAAGSDPFKGSYSTLDIDGSLMYLSFSGSGATRVVTFTDARATCLGGATMTQSGVGTIVGDTISGTFSDGGCGGGGFELQADAANKTLTDEPDETLTWHRGDQGPDAFSGVWLSTDNDGSAQRLSLEGSGLNRDVSFFDDGASVCGPVVDGEGINWSGSGTGTIGSVPGQGRFIFVDLVGGCAGGGRQPVPTITFEYLYGSNQLLDSYGVTWSRK